MLKVNREELDRLEGMYPGIGSLIQKVEETELPACARCGSPDTAEVGIGLVGFSMNLAGATTKYKLLANGPAPGKYFCNSCEKFFGPIPSLKGGTLEGGPGLRVEKIEAWIENMLGRPLTDEERAYGRGKLGSKFPSEK
jgi:hypothetical protein